MDRSIKEIVDNFKFTGNENDHAATIDELSRQVWTLGAIIATFHRAKVDEIPAQIKEMLAVLDGDYYTKGGE